MSLERRFLVSELRAEKKGDEMSLDGYALKFNQPSEDLGGFEEIVQPGACAKSIRDKNDVKFLVDHDPSRVLGRVKNGSLKLEEDGVGLRFHVKLPNTQLGRDTHELVKNGTLDSCSFAFVPTEQSWEDGTDKDGKPMARRKLMSVDLRDCSVVLNPAYPNTEVTARNLFDEQSLIEVRSAVKNIEEARAKTDKGHGSFNQAKNADSAADHLNAARKHVLKAIEMNSTGQTEPANKHWMAGAAHYDAAAAFTGEKPEGDKDLSKKAREASERCDGGMRSMDAPSDQERCDMHTRCAGTHAQMRGRHYDRMKSELMGGHKSAADMHERAYMAHGDAATMRGNAAADVSNKEKDYSALSSSHDAWKSTSDAHDASSDAAQQRSVDISDESRGSDAQPWKLTAVGLPQPFDPKAKEDWWNAFADAYDDLVKKGGRGYGVMESIGKAIATANQKFPIKTETDAEVDGQKKDPTAVPHEVVNTEATADPRSKEEIEAEKRAKEAKCDCRCERCADSKHAECTADERCGMSTRGENMDPRSSDDMGCGCQCEDCVDGDCCDCSNPDCADPLCDCDDEERKKAKEKAEGDGADSAEDPDDGAVVDTDADDPNGSQDRSAKTKKKGGKDLHASDFAFVGDAKDPSTWKLPIHDEAHARNALARFTQAKGIPTDKKDAVWGKIVSAAKKHGIDVSEEKSMRAGIDHKVTAAALKEVDDAGIKRAFEARLRLIKIELED